MANAAYYTEVMDDRAEDLQAMLDILKDVRANYTLIGGIAVGFHGYQRATSDVDMLVSSRSLKKIANAAREDGFVVRMFPDMIRIWPPNSSPDKDESIADFVSMEANPVLRAAFNEADTASVLGQRANIIRLGPLCALKFHSAMSQSRLIEDKLQDVADIGHIIKIDFTKRDEAAGKRIATLSYPGAGDEFAELLDDLRHGRRIRI